MKKVFFPSDFWDTIPGGCTISGYHSLDILHAQKYPEIVRKKLELNEIMEKFDKISEDLYLKVVQPPGNNIWRLQNLRVLLPGDCPTSR